MPGCSKKCRESILVILVDFHDGLIKDQILVIQRASKQWPVKNYKIRIIETVDASDKEAVNKAVNLTNDYVKKYYCKGYKKSILPNSSTILSPFLLGSTVELNGIPFQTRFPDMTSMVTNPGTPTVNITPNVWRMYDTFTAADGLLETAYIKTILGETGEMLILYQDADALSIGLNTYYTKIATSLGKICSSSAIPFTTSPPSYNFTDVSSKISALPANSMIISICSSSFDAWAKSGKDDGIFLSENNNGPLINYGGNFLIRNVTIPVKLYINAKTVATPGPSSDMVSLGYSSNYYDWLAANGLWAIYDLLPQAFAWLATCQTYTGQDNRLKFSHDGNNIDLFIIYPYYPADVKVIVPGTYQVNPRWIDEKNDFSSLV